MKDKQMSMIIANMFVVASFLAEGIDRLILSIAGFIWVGIYIFITIKEAELK